MHGDAPRIEAGDGTEVFPRMSYEVDPSASEMSFRSRAFSVGWVQGTFPIVEGNVALEGAKMTAVGLLAADRVDTGLATRDWHLRSSHYLGASVHPRIRVRVPWTDTSAAIVRAEVTLREVTSNVQLYVAEKSVRSDKLELTATGSIDRTVYPMLPPWCGVSRVLHVEVKIFARRI